jgi:hypothetical protein
VGEDGGFTIDGIVDRLVADGIFAAFAAVGFCTDAVHGDREDFMRFAGECAQRHTASTEPFDDIGHRLD